MGACASRLQGRGAVAPLPPPLGHAGSGQSHYPSFEGHTLFKSEIRHATAPNLLRLLHIDLKKVTGKERTSPATGGMRVLANSSSAGHGSSCGSVDGITPDSAIKVAVLVRPLLDHEQAEAEVVHATGPTSLRVQQPAGSTTGVSGGAAPAPITHTFDSVHSTLAARESEQLFRLHGLPVVERFCSGFNSCIMAYGQTGSGKTHSLGMGRPITRALESTGADAHSDGAFAMLPSVARAIFDYVRTAGGSQDISLKVQFIEIFNEQVLDLLCTFTPAVGRLAVPGGGSGARADVREVGGQVVVEGTAVVEVPSLQALAEAVDWGAAMRATASHKLNDQSSRSHAILLLTMEQRAKPDAMHKLPRELHFLRSRLSVVDLAGSERVKQTGAEGARFTEGIHINQSLLTLGKCVNAIVEKQRHVPYRESKLTRVLQDSLGGTAETLMLACVSPAACHLEQTLNTLRYAQRAQKVHNHLKLQNTMSVAEEVLHLRALVERLEHDNTALRLQVQQLEQQQEQQQPSSSSPSRQVHHHHHHQQPQRPPPVEFIVNTLASEPLKTTTTILGGSGGTVVPSLQAHTAKALNTRAPIRCRTDSAREPYEADLTEADGVAAGA